MDLFAAIRIQALKDAINPDQDAQIRRIHRWYSRTFATPLHEALELPLEDVVQAYFEEHYDGMEEEELEFERQELLEDPAKKKEKTKALDAKAAEDDDFARRIEAEEKVAKEAQKKQPPKPVDPKKAEMTLPMDKTKQLPPDISIKFVDPEEFEQELEGFGIMAPPPRKPQS